MKNKYYCISLLIITSFISAKGQNEEATETGANEIVIQSLFEYPVAPEEMETLQERTDYIMENFWNPFDFKNRNVVDQSALNHAFDVYTSSMPYASPEKVIESTEKLIKNLKKNPILSLQFAKAAEESLYGPRAKFWIDDIYIMFLKNIADNKDINVARKARYIDQLNILTKTSVDAQYPPFTYTDKSGNIISFKPSKEFTLIEFGNPDCEDCRYTKLHLDISGTISDLLNDNRLEVMFIIPDDEDGTLLAMTDDYPEKWTVGSSDDVMGVYDLRATPAIYILDKNGKIAAKNVSVDTAIGILELMSKSE